MAQRMRSNASNYVRGQSTQEYERLIPQARIPRPYSEWFFRTAGTGPGGRVAGLDRDATGLERARQRTMEQGCSSWVWFQAANLDDSSTTQPFDAVAGRYPSPDDALSQARYPINCAASGLPGPKCFSITRFSLSLRFVTVTPRVAAAAVTKSSSLVSWP